MNVQLQASKMALEEKNERERLQSMNEIEWTEKMSNLLCDIEKRLVDNGRTCKNLDQEIVALRDFEASEHLGWWITSSDKETFKIQITNAKQGI